MNKLWLLILVPVLIFSGFACVGNDDGAAADSLSAKIAAMQATILQHTTVIDQVKSDLTNKASKSEIDDLNRKINNLPQGGSTPADVATKAIVDQKIADAISALKADQAWIKGATGGGSGGIINPGDNVLATNGQLILALEKPVEEELYLADGDHQTFKLTITNNDTTSHTFRLKADFDCETAVPLAAGTLLDTDYSYSDGAIMKCNIALPTTSDVTNIGFTSTRGGTSTDTTWYIGKQRSESIYLSLTMDYTGTVPAKRWSWDFGLSQRD